MAPLPPPDRGFRTYQPDRRRDNPYRPFQAPVPHVAEEHAPTAHTAGEAFLPGFSRGYLPAARARQRRHPATAHPGANLLLVDDREDFQELFLDFYRPRGYRITLVPSGADALQAVFDRGPAHFHAVVSDISMEMEQAGIHLARRLRQEGYRGTLTLASTAFDTWFGLLLNLAFLPALGVDWLIPKRSVKRKRFRFIRCRRWW